MLTELPVTPVTVTNQYACSSLDCSLSASYCMHAAAGLDAHCH